MSATIQMHERTEDGRDRHLFLEKDRYGCWVCECGERRDQFGRPVKTRLSITKEAQ